MRTRLKIDNRFPRGATLLFPPVSHGDSPSDPESFARLTRLNAYAPDNERKKYKCEREDLERAAMKV